jgi:hypothetical protein
MAILLESVLMFLSGLVAARSRNGELSHGQMVAKLQSVAPKLSPVEIQKSLV